MTPSDYAAWVCAVFVTGFSGYIIGFLQGEKNASRFRKP
jgi:uncharacterized membrane protein